VVDDMNSVAPFSYRFEYSLTENDVESILIFNSRLPIYKILYILIVALLSILLFYVFGQNSYDFIIVLIAAFIIIIFLRPVATKQDVNKVCQYQIKKRPDQYLINETQEVILNQDGIENISKYKKGKFSWNEIKNVLSDANNVYLYLSFRSIIVIPRRLFNSNDEYEKFINKVKETHTAARKNPGGVA
jgi:hypothetical protein